MFGCKECEILKEQIAHLRKENSKLIDRGMALADARAYNLVKKPELDSTKYYTAKDAEPEFYDDLGRELVVKKAEDETVV